MASTKYSLVEQISRKLEGGSRSVSSRFSWGEIEKAVEQQVNFLLRPQYFQTLQAGESIPEGCVLITYENIPVTAWNGISKSILPAIPVTLPKNMGVFRISKAQDPFAGEFIPIGSGQMSMVMAQRMISDLLGQIGYELRGKDVYYTKDLTAQSPACTAVTMQLVVMDFTQYSDTDILPLNADLEAQVIENVYKSFAPEPVTPQAVDTQSDTK